jgi:hypothetical protein
MLNAPGTAPPHAGRTGNAGAPRWFPDTHQEKLRHGFRSWTRPTFEHAPNRWDAKEARGGRAIREAEFDRRTGWACSWAKAGSSVRIGRQRLSALSTATRIARRLSNKQMAVVGGKSSFFEFFLLIIRGAGGAIPLVQGAILRCDTIIQLETGINKLQNARRAVVPNGSQRGKSKHV